MSASTQLRNRLLSALGASALVAVAIPQCAGTSGGDDTVPTGVPEPNAVGPTRCDRMQCYSLEQVDEARRQVLDSGLGGAAGAPDGDTTMSSAVAGEGGASPTQPPALDFPSTKCQPSDLATLSIVIDGNPIGPVSQSGSLCCYTVETTHLCPGGRPFVVDGRARVADSATRSDWNEGAWRSTVSDSSLRERLAAAWLADAHAEHASVASFARLTLDLLALGAPPELVAASQRASLEEIEHAQLCFALASSHARVPYGPGRFALGGPLGALDLCELVTRTIEEGCVGETIAALVVAEQARQATEPALRRSLERMAADEATHAELSWKIVRWALASSGAEVRTAARSAFARATPRAVTRFAAATSPEWLSQGRLGQGELQDIARDAHELVIQPCARALV